MTSFLDQEILVAINASISELRQELKEAQDRIAVLENQMDLENGKLTRSALLIKQSLRNNPFD